MNTVVFYIKAVKYPFQEGGMHTFQFKPTNY